MKYKKTAEESVDLFGNKIEDQITKKFLQDSSETTATEHDKNLPKETYIYI